MTKPKQPKSAATKHANRKQRRAHLQRPMKGETFAMVAADEPIINGIHYDGNVEVFIGGERIGNALSVNFQPTRLGSDAEVHPPGYWLSRAEAIVGGSLSHGKREAMNAQIVKAIMGRDLASEIGPVEPENEFFPRLAHCHPSHRWTRREGDSVELWCACGATPGREVLPMFSSRFPCPVHDPAHARMWSTGVTRRDVFSDLARILLGATLDLEYKARMTERERCEWVGVEWLADNYQPDHSRYIDDEALLKEEYLRRSVEMAADYVLRVLANWGDGASGLETARRADMDSAYASESYDQHGGIVRHFGFGQDPHQ